MPSRDHGPREWTNHPRFHRMGIASRTPRVKTSGAATVMSRWWTWMQHSPRSVSPRQLTGLLPMGRSNIAWSRDAAFVIFNAEEVQLNYLWRVGVDGEHPPERIETGGVNALFPTTSPTGDRLAFSRVTHDRDIYRFQPGQAVQPVARSSVADEQPAVLAGRPANRILLAAIGRRNARVGCQRGWIIAGAADPRPGFISVSAVLVARRPANRVRVGR